MLALPLVIGQNKHASSEKIWFDRQADARVSLCGQRSAIVNLACKIGISSPHSFFLESSSYLVSIGYVTVLWQPDSLTIGQLFCMYIDSSELCDKILRICS
jgi:hypothetical protein